MPFDTQQLQRYVDAETVLPKSCDPLYDWEADVLCVTFERIEADDSDFTDDDVLLRYRDGRLIGITLLHASKRGLDLEGLPSFPADTSTVGRESR